MGNAKNESYRDSANFNETVDVLCQKMGDRWYAFSLIDDEVFVGSLTDAEISRAAEEGAYVEKKAGNS